MKDKISLNCLILYVICSFFSPLFAQSVEKFLSHQDKEIMAQKLHPYLVRIKRTSVLKENLYRPGSLEQWGYGLLLEEGILTHLGWLEPKVDEEQVLVELYYEGQILKDPMLLKKDPNLGLPLFSYTNHQHQQELKKPIFPKQIVAQRSKNDLFFGQRTLDDQHKDQELLLLTQISSESLKLHEVLYLYEGKDQPVARIQLEGKGIDFFAYYHLCKGLLPYGAPLFTLTGEVKGISAGSHPTLIGYSLILPPQAIKGLLSKEKKDD